MKLTNTAITGDFFKKYYSLIINELMPYQWDVLNDKTDAAEKSHAIENIKIAAGASKGEFSGMLFQDSDFAKWLEALGYCLQKGDLQNFRAKADEIINYIAQAQEADGYFNTYFQLTAPERKFTNLHEAHELYCAGHLIEAAAAYYEATKNEQVLSIAQKLADLICSRFGEEPGQIRGYAGHQEIELALIKLYELTNNENYLKTACFFLDERGAEPNFFIEEAKKRGGFSEWSKRTERYPSDFTYNQAHKRVREQFEAKGHAVRAVYMYTAMAEAARLTNDATLLNACEKLFDNITQKQMYITGGIGQTNHGEAFTYDYDLPNDINYSETCASIGLIFFAHSMLKMNKNSKYADTIELALYNTVLSSVQTDGKRYFYVNPMEAVPENNQNPARAHVKAVRQKWHVCACCPPNLARLLASLEKYIYMWDDNILYINQYISSVANFESDSGHFKVEMQSGFPNSGEVSVCVKSFAGEAVALRIPAWCKNYTFTMSGNAIKPEIKDGYAYVKIPDIKGNFDASTDTFDILRVNFIMEPEFIYANTAVRADAGKTCVKRGPLVYCLEETDNIHNLHNLSVNTKSDLILKPGNIGGFDFYAITADGFAESASDKGELYTSNEPIREDMKLNFVPYFLWGNRQRGEMICWVRR
ncbi:MAG: glycoside hydrolase family 127 protein [Clostridiales bacterium]|jgi:DUF1680 family protein|nr:glycoside hydrolase family 127 protein [Clostridiales bacterium]